MLVIGLTGGIASGKTTISNLFSIHNVAIVDTDIISRHLLEYQQPGYEQIYQKFGNDILLENKSVDRARLRHLVFNDAELKYWLESVMHPLIHQAARSEIQEQRNAAYVILVVPLLFESEFTDLIDRVLVVDCSRKTQLERLIHRDNIDETLANKMLDQQWSNNQRLALADDIIENNGTKNLQQQVARLHRKYLDIANPKKPEPDSTAK